MRPIAQNNKKSVNLIFPKAITIQAITTFAETKHRITCTSVDL
jgi:hypothetical protein